MFMMTPSGSSADIALTGANIYQMCFTDPNQGMNAAALVAEKAMGENIAIIYDSSDAYSVGLRDGFTAKAAELNLNIVCETSFTSDTKYRSIREHERMAKQIASAPVREKKEKKERPKGGTKDQDKLVRRLEREIEKQEKVVADYDPKIEAASADYQELTRLLAEKEEAELVLMDLMEQWEAAQE